MMEGPLRGGGLLVLLVAVNGGGGRGGGGYQGLFGHRVESLRRC